LRVVPVLVRESTTVAPVSKVTVILAVLKTDSLRVARMLMLLPGLYVPLAVVEVKLTRVGGAASITKFLLALNDPVAPGEGRVKIASVLSDVATIVPPLNVKEFVDA
jgi:hypothetical protein